MVFPMVYHLERLKWKRIVGHHGSSASNGLLDFRCPSPCGCSDRPAGVETVVHVSPCISADPTRLGEDNQFGEDSRFAAAANWGAGLGIYNVT